MLDKLKSEIQQRKHFLKNKRKLSSFQKTEAKSKNQLLEKNDLFEMKFNSCFTLDKESNNNNNKDLNKALFNKPESTNYLYFKMCNYIFGNKEKLKEKESNKIGLVNLILKFIFLFFFLDYRRNL